MMAPILAEVLYDKGPMWPLAAFGPFMALAAVSSGTILISTTTIARRTTRGCSPLHEDPLRVLFPVIIFQLHGNARMGGP